MGTHTLSIISQLNQRIEEIINDIDLVSVDIFDTLMERTIEPPEAVKFAAARRFATLYREECFAADVILATRVEVEAELRRQNHRNGYDHECAFSAVAMEIAHRLAPGRESAISEALIACEIEIEKEALYPKEGAAEMLAMLKNCGKRVVAISDMYLDGKIIRLLLRNFDLERFIDFIYVSSDVKLGKYSGRLFEHVLKIEEIEPARMMHFGDHRHSDFMVPKALGIHAFHFRDMGNILRRQRGHTLSWLGGRNRFWRGRHLLHLIPSPKSDDFLYRYGHAQLGPIFCGFILGLIEEMNRLNAGRIFFLAREGELFRHLYKKMAPALEGTQLPDCYLYISRKSVFLPAAWQGLSRRLLNAVLYNPKQKGLFSLANALGIPTEEFAGVAHRFGLSGVDQPIRAWPESDLVKLINDCELQRIVSHHARSARDLLRGYLEQEGFFDETSVVLVDIGWNGTIQNSLRDAFGEDADFPKVTGLYLSFNDGFKYGFNHDEAKGILYDSSSSPHVHNVFSQFEELFENTARAFHGTTSGYRWSDETAQVEPILRDDGTIDRVAERAYELQTTMLRQGVLDFADDFIRAIHLTGYQFDDIKPIIIDIAERGVIYPTTKEVAHLLEMVHTEDLGSENIMMFRDYKVEGLTALLHPRRFTRLLRASNWKYGTARTLGVPGFNYMLRQLELILIARRLTQPDRTVPSRPSLIESVLFTLVNCRCFPALSWVRKLWLRIGGL